MELINIKGNTFYIKGGTNTGIYLFEDHTAVMIDPGLSGLRPKRIMKILANNNISLKFIVNTHEHDDHYGSCNQFKLENKDIKVLSSKYAKIYIDNPELFSKYIVGGRANNFFNKGLKNESLDNLKVDDTLDEGKVILNREIL